MSEDVPSKVTTVLEALEWRARETPARLVFSIEGREIGYGDLHRRVLSASGMLQRLGVRPGDCCGLLLPTSLDFMIALYAVQACAAVPVAINPSLPMDWIHKLVDVAGCNTLIARADHLADLPHEPRETGPLLRLADVHEMLQAEVSPAQATASDRSKVPAFLQFTSGTTGQSRAAVVSHAGLLAVLEASQRRLEITQDDILAGYSPLHHNMGLVRYAFGTVHAGCSAYLVPPSIANIPAWLRMVSQVRATLTSGSDYAYRAATQLVPAGSIDLSSLRLAVSGGEPVRLSTIRAFEERFGVPGIIRPAYGLAEATLTVTSMAAGEALRVDASGTVSCGRPLQHTQVKVVDEHGREAEPGIQGMILARGPQLFSGYRGDEQATRQALRDGWLHTGDWGSQDQDGFLYVLGRREGMIKRAGVTIACRSVEEAAEQAGAFSATAALSLWSSGEEGADVILLVAELKEGKDYADLALNELASRVARSIQSALGFAPGRILLVSPGTLPRTGSGKIQYGQLRQMISSGDLERGNRILLRRTGE